MYSFSLKGEEFEGRRGFYGEEYFIEEAEAILFEDEQRRYEEIYDNEYYHHEEPYMEEYPEFHEFIEEEHFFEEFDEIEPIRWEWHFDEFEAKVVFFKPATDEVRELPVREVVDIYEINGLLAITVLKPEQERSEPQIHTYDLKNERFSEEMHMCKHEEDLYHIWDRANMIPERLFDVLVIPLKMEFMSAPIYCDWISKIPGAKSVTLSGLANHQSCPTVWEGKINGCKQIRVLYVNSSYSTADLVLYDPITKKAAKIVPLKGHIYSKIEKDNVVYLDVNQSGYCDLYLYDIANQKNTKLISSISVHDISYAGDYITYHDGKSIVLYQISKKTKQTLKKDSATVKYGLYLDTDGKSIIYSEGKFNTTTYDTLWDVYVYDIAKKTTKKITTKSYNASTCSVYTPSIDGNRAILQKGWGSTGQLDIIQVSNLSTTALKSTTEGYTFSAISGNRVAYIAFTNSSGNFHSCVYDLTDKKEVYRSKETYTETLDIYNNHFVYETYAGKDADIVYTPLVNIPASIKPYMNWLYYMKNGRYPQNKALVNSYDKDYKTAYTYDQALAIIAFTYVSDYASADTILANLKSLMKDKCLTIAYRKDKNEPYHVDRHIGPNAWVVQAINYYTNKTGDKKYQSMAKDIVDWMLTSQKSSGTFKDALFGGYEYKNGSYKKIDEWASTEHNLSAYAAIRHFADTFYTKGSTDWNKYMAPITKTNPGGNATRIRKFLETKMWINDVISTHRFITGVLTNPTTKLLEPNYGGALDVNSWGILALGKKAENTLTGGIDDNFSIGLKWAYDNCMTKNEKGFSFWKHADYQKYNIIWTEGTEGMVLAMKRYPITIKSGKNATHFHNQVKALSKTSTNGTGIYYSTESSSLPTTKQSEPYLTNYDLSVAGTAWCIFSELNFNPLDFD